MNVPADTRTAVVTSVLRKVEVVQVRSVETETTARVAWADVDTARAALEAFGFRPATRDGGLLVVSADQFTE